MYMYMLCRGDRHVLCWIVTESKCSYGQCVIERYCCNYVGSILPPCPTPASLPSTPPV